MLNFYDSLAFWRTLRWSSRPEKAFEARVIKLIEIFICSTHNIVKMTFSVLKRIFFAILSNKHIFFKDNFKIIFLHLESVINLLKRWFFRENSIAGFSNRKIWRKAREAMKLGLLPRTPCVGGCFRNESKYLRFRNLNFFAAKICIERRLWVTKYFHFLVL